MNIKDFKIELDFSLEPEPSLQQTQEILDQLEIIYEQKLKEVQPFRSVYNDTEYNYDRWCSNRNEWDELHHNLFLISLSIVHQKVSFNKKYPEDRGSIERRFKWLRILKENPTKDPLAKRKYL